MAESEPGVPRRLFVAAALAALGAGGATALGVFGALGAPETEAFGFSRANTFATGEETRLRGHLSRALEDDRLGVVIVGHSGTLGDDAANLALSEERAAAVRALAVGMGIAPGRIAATGVGGGAPLAREPGQSDRAHEASLARVEVTLRMRR